MVDPKAQQRLMNLGEEIIDLARRGGTTEETALAGLAQVHHYFTTPDRPFGALADKQGGLPPQYWPGTIVILPGSIPAGCQGVPMAMGPMICQSMVPQMPARQPPAPK
jgi:hypothetical protein